MSALEIGGLSGSIASTPAASKLFSPSDMKSTVGVDLSRVSGAYGFSSLLP